MDSYIKAHLRENLIQFDAEIGEQRTIQVVHSKYANDPVSFSLHVHSLQSETSVSWFFDVQGEDELEGATEFHLQAASMGSYRLTFQIQYYAHDTNYFILHNISTC